MKANRDAEEYEGVVVTGSEKRLLTAVASIAISLLLATAAFSSIFTRFGIKDELAIDAVGVTSFIVALIASALVYPLRSKIGFRILWGFCVVVAVLLGVEFLGGLLWFSLDKIVRYEQRR